MSNGNPSRYRTSGTLLAATLSLLLAPVSGLAQGGFAGGFASPDALDALNSQGVGAGGAGQLVLDRARGVAGAGPASPYEAGNPFGAAAPYAAADPFGGAPAGGFGAADPFGAGAAAPGFASPYDVGDGGFAGAGGPFAQGQPALGPGVVRTIPTVIAIYGERVVCPVTGKILRDADEVPVFQSFVDNYYDDGVNGLDYRANDKVYTSVTLVTDQMDPEAHLVKSRLIQALRTLETYDPLRFRGIAVASTDPVANVEQIYGVDGLEARRDYTLEQFAKRFLNEFRVDPDAGAGSWKFHPTYMPPPPFPPLDNIPGNFRPHFDSKQEKADQARLEALQRAGGGQQGGQFGGGQGLDERIGTSAIPQNPGASSSYF